MRWLGANAAPEPSLIRLSNRFRYLFHFVCKIFDGDITQRCSRNRGFLRLLPSFTFFLTMGAGQVAAIGDLREWRAAVNIPCVLEAEDRRY